MLNLEDQYDRIYRYLYFHLHDKHEAEDLTQEARKQDVSGREPSAAISLYDRPKSLQSILQGKDDNIQFGRTGGKFHPV